MSDPSRVRIGRVLGAMSIILGFVGTLVLAALGRWDFLIEDFVLNNAVFAIGLGALASVVLPAQPRNGAVWTVVWSAVFSSLYVTGEAALTLLYSDATLATIQTMSPSELSRPAAIALGTAAWTWIPGGLLIFTLGFLLFPDGSLPSPRWRWLGWLCGITIAATSIVQAWTFQPTSTAKLGDGISGSVAAYGYLSMFVLALLCLASVVVRYQRSSNEVRGQIRVIGWGGVGFMAGTLASLSADLTDQPVAVEASLFLAGQIILVVAFATAVLKFRLYDVDVVISKTVTYVVLATFIAAVYVGLVVGVSELIGGRSSFFLSIVATIVIAIAFQPVRRIVQRAANRLVFGRRATPYEVLAGFSHQAAGSTDDELLERVPKLVVDGTSAARATLWVRIDDGFQAAGSWPEGDVDPDAGHTVPIIHDGDQLGALTVVAGRGEAITPPDRRLLEDLAAGLGLTLRNSRLTSRLRQRVADLEASRRRILTAADSARRALEYDLDQGPQQQLMEVKEGLGPLAQRTTGKVATMLIQLEADAAAAIETVRDFSRGVFPPVLEAEGLTAALTQQAQAAALPVSIRDHGVRRYPRDVEAAVYFTILEALQNATKHAEADSICVTVADNDGTLGFEVHDDGRGFDMASVNGDGMGLRGLADRVDAVGGKVRIESTLGEGTTIAGSVPEAARQRARVT